MKGLSVLAFIYITECEEKRMIYTITLNPALDRMLVVERLLEDDTTRTLSEVRYAGGKGILRCRDCNSYDSRDRTTIPGFGNGNEARIGDSATG